MTRARAAFAAVVVASLAVIATPAARADDGDGEPRLIPSGDGEPLAAPRGDHKGQFGLGLSLVTGYRLIKTWDNGRYCGDRGSATNGGGNAVYCVGHTPLSLDVALSYGLTPTLELLLDVRFGLERDFGTSATTSGPRLRHYAPGVKVFLGGPGQVKYFSTAQLAIDTTDYKDASGASLGTDVRLRNANGLQVDFHDAYGVYVYFAEELAFSRWLEGGVEAGAGIQGRYP